MTFNELHEELTKSIPDYLDWNRDIHPDCIAIYGNPVDDSTIFNASQPLIVIRRSPKEGQMWTVRCSRKVGRLLLRYKSTKGLIKGVRKKLIAGINHLKEIRADKQVKLQQTEDTYRRIKHLIKEYGEEYFSASGAYAYVNYLGETRLLDIEEETITIGRIGNNAKVPLYLLMDFVRQVKTLQLIE